MSDETTKILLEIQKDMGKVLNGQDNLQDHIKSVSEKANRIREELNDHKESGDAHGIGSTVKTLKWVGSLIGGAIAAFETFMHVGHK